MYKKLIKILIVDDDPADRKLVKLALKKSAKQIMKFEIGTAESLSQGLEMLQDGTFDLVMLDLGLADSQGIVTVEAVRKSYPDIPIIVLTGLAGEDVGVEAIRAGAVDYVAIDYVTKPCKPDALRTRIGIAMQIAGLQKKLLSLANTDGLTGLANHRYFFDVLEREILQARIKNNALSVMILDIDHFKSVNDTYGHLGGDEVLRQMGKIFQENLYPLDLAARYGGEEFIIMMPETSSEQALKTAEKLRHIIDSFQWEVMNKRISVTVSAGLVTLNSANLIDSSDIVLKADTALYAAKRQGRNCVVQWHQLEKNKNTDAHSNQDYCELQDKVSTLARQLRSHALGTVMAFRKVMDLIIEDPQAVQRGENIREYAIALAEQMDLSDELVNRIGTAALLHNLGEITIPSHILKKASPLTDEEYRLIRQHPAAAVKILEPVGIFNLELPTILHHHENFDGTGYPNGLKGRQIPIGSRILAVVDAFDAITSQRPHRQSGSCDEAVAEITSCSGSQFDPEVVDALVRAVQQHETFWPLFDSSQASADDTAAVI
ncbi:MAG: diguanylate cyclase [Planctomycetes bacterium]|nr:diguanylate cyclase [Planctomycetota bacterium]